MADTFGSLVDKLTIVNIKLFVVQDAVHEAAREHKDLPAAEVEKLASLNQQRNSLMREIDQCFADGVSSGVVAVDPRIKIL